MARTLVFTAQPPNVIAGRAIAPAPVVEIRKDGVLENVNANVSIDLLNPPGGLTISGTKTRAAVNGVVSFPGLIPSASAAGLQFRAFCNDGQVGFTPQAAPGIDAAGLWWLFRCNDERSPLTEEISGLTNTTSQADANFYWAYRAAVPTGFGVKPNGAAAAMRTITAPLRADPGLSAGFTLQALCKLNAAGRTTDYVLAPSDGTNVLASIQPTPTGFRFSMRFSGQNLNPSALVSTDLRGTFAHLAMTYRKEGSVHTIRLYRNGVLLGTDTSATSAWTVFGAGGNIQPVIGGLGAAATVGNYQDEIAEAGVGPWVNDAAILTQAQRCGVA